jgi:hypothetical protein
MIKPMSRLQKVVAYGSLVMVLAFTVFGVHAIWLILTRHG